MAIAQSPDRQDFSGLLLYHPWCVALTFVVQDDAGDPDITPTLQRAEWRNEEQRLTISNTRKLPETPYNISTYQLLAKILSHDQSFLKKISSFIEI